MPVDAESHADIGMAENFLYDFGVDFHTQEDSRCAMSQVMHAHEW